MSHHIALLWITDTTDIESARDQADDFLNRNGDENNWYTILEACSSTGGHWATEGGAGLETFQAGLDAAMKVHACELAWHSPDAFRAIEGFPQPTSLGETKEVVFQSIRAHLTSFHSGVGAEDFLPLWHMKKLAQILLSVRYVEHFPWVEEDYRGVLYDHRCFRLGNETLLPEGGVIVAADVHT